MVDAAAGLIKIITRQDLIQHHVNGLCEQYIVDYKNLFDDGEMYAIALAKAMGLFGWNPCPVNICGGCSRSTSELLSNLKRNHIL
jgi:hypothetical protein